ncbi:MAG TPA: YggT family protein [Micropepsaceae bacterium]|nr:YggT family protein [Micropepsaceae bacterium]HRK70046.1 YggT family protein [Micropepsaceae bacterium]
MGHPLYPIFWAVDVLFGVLIALIIIDVVMSWLINFNVVNTRNQIVYTIRLTTERVLTPLLRPIRRLLPPMGGIDFSPLVLLLLVYVVRMYFWQLFYWIIT